MIGLVCVSLSGCPAPRLRYLLTAPCVFKPEKFVKGKWEFGGYRISYKVFMEQSPEIGQDIAIILGVNNRSDSSLLYDWTVARITCGEGDVAPSKRGFTTTFTAPDTFPAILPAKSESWEWIFFKDGNPILASDSCIVEAGLIRDGNGKALLAIPAFVIKRGDTYVR